MFCNVIKQYLPNDVLSLIYSFVFVPVFRCNTCHRTFGKSTQYCHRSSYVNTSHTSISKQYPVLFLCGDRLPLFNEISRNIRTEQTGQQGNRLYDTSQRMASVLGTFMFCSTCISRHACATLIEPNLQCSFFQDMQIIILQQHPTSHLFHVLCCDWSDDVPLLRSIQDVERMLNLTGSSSFRGYMYYKVMVPIERIDAIINPLHGFEDKLFHFYKNETCLFSDLFINFRCSIQGQPFTTWVEGGFVDAMLSNDYGISYATLISSIYLYSSLTKYWMIQQLIFEEIIEEHWPPSEFLSQTNGELIHLPTQNGYTFDPFYLSRPENISFVPFLHLLSTSHPTDSTNAPYRQNTMHSTMSLLLSYETVTDSSSEYGTDSDIE